MAKYEDPIFAAYRKTSRVEDLKFWLRNAGAKMTPQTKTDFEELLGEAMRDRDKNRMPTSATLTRYIILTQRYWLEEPGFRPCQAHMRVTPVVLADPEPDQLDAWDADGGAPVPIEAPPISPSTPVHRRGRSTARPALTWRYAWSNKTGAVEGTVEASSEKSARDAIKIKHGLKWVPDRTTLARIQEAA